MRVLVLALLLLPALAGCTGLGSSTRSCAASSPLDEGVRIELPEPDRAVGYCMKLRANDFDHEAMAKVGADGVVWFALPQEGRYAAHVHVEQAEDKFCADDWAAYIVYEGGLLNVTAEKHVVCS